MTFGPCLCGDPYCPSCGPAQGFFKCRHGKIQDECEVEGCVNYYESEKYTPEQLQKAQKDEFEYWEAWDKKFFPQPEEEVKEE